ncbi:MULTISPECIES: S1C family serine protease [Blautia]|uniref:S1C family serine protease n=1 Tax=Blautia TaxID=572511 RepID=UPI00136E43B2|nr:trypsin-like peptidase domain-containing protein [Blautia sp. BIOML-A1]MZT65630.1 trypsin-like serine protease [Blautia sp. BIOML-A1]
MDDESRWNPAPQNKKTVEDSNVPPSYAHYHMHQGTSTQKSEISDKKPTRKKQRSRNKLGTTIGLAVVFGLVAGIVFQGVNLTTERFLETDTEQKNQVETAQLTKETTADSKDTQNSVVSSEVTGSVASVAKTAMPTVVAITSVSIQEIPYYFGFGFSSRSTQQYSSEGSGSGIIVGENDDELLIATNNHVVSGATTLNVCFMGSDVVSAEQETAETAADDSADINVEDAVSAKIKGTDESNDLAVIAVAKADIPQDTLSEIKIAQLDTSDDLEVGEQVVAIGNALGYGQSVTSGWISALNRTISTDDMTGSGLIQTDAAINPGNSGGALLNMKGEVIGINSAKFASNAVEGMGYAIPISKAQPILEDLMSRETRDKVDSSEASYLGINPLDLSAEVTAMFDMPEGVFVSSVSTGEAADNAGIRKGDIITGFDGQTVTGRDDLNDKMKYYAAGETVDITIARAQNGQYVEQTVQVTLGSRPSAD